MKGSPNVISTCVYGKESFLCTEGVCGGRMSTVSNVISPSF